VGISTEISYSSGINENSMFTDDTNEDILTHLESMDSCHSMHQSMINDDLICCLQHMELCQFFNGLSYISNPENPIMNHPENDNQLAEQMIENTKQETEWRDCYEKRWTKWKQNQTAKDLSKSCLPTNHDISSMTIEMLQTRPSEMHETFVPDIQSHSHPIDEFCDVNSDHVAQEWSSNNEQSRAFKLIAEHSQASKPEPLKMFIGGPAGTGKSRVINALKDFFIRQNQT